MTTPLGRLISAIALPIEIGLTMVKHDWATARKVRRYWRDNGRSHLPCLWCVHDTEIADEPIWLWCVRPCRATADRYGNLHHLGCDWGNQ